MLPKIVSCRAGALFQWLWEETHVSKVVGSNPGAGYWMDMTFFTLICCKNCIVCLKKTKINKKEAGMAHILKKSQLYLLFCSISFSADDHRPSRDVLLKKRQQEQLFGNLIQNCSASKQCTQEQYAQITTSNEPIVFFETKYFSICVSFQKTCLQFTYLIAF